MSERTSLGPLGDEIVSHLRLIEESREETLTEAEYLDLRRAALDQLSSPPSILHSGAPWLGVALVVSTIASVAGYRLGNETLFLACLVISTILAFMIALVAYEMHRNSRLPSEQRFFIVDHLQSRSMISVEEAEQLRFKIREGFFGGPFGERCRMKSSFTPS